MEEIVEGNITAPKGLVRDRESRKSPEIRSRGVHLQENGRASHLYVIEDEAHRIKIGVSRNPRSRLQTMQTSCAGRLRLHKIFKVGVGKAFPIEQAAHRALYSCRVRGEWFAVEDGVAQHLVAALIEGRQDIVDLLARRADLKFRLERLYPQMSMRRDCAARTRLEAEEDVLSVELNEVISQHVALGVLTNTWDDIYGRIERHA